MFLIEETKMEDSIACGSIGGDVWLPKSSNVPRCARCNNEMALYLQLEVKEAFRLPFKTGSRLNFFSCPEHDDLALEQYTNRDKCVQSTYNTEVHVHYSLMLLGPDLDLEKKGIEPRILEKPIFARESEEEIEESEYVGRTSLCHRTKVGGVPAWLNYAVNLNCTCGGKLEFLCRIRDGTTFHYGKGPVEYYRLLNANFIYLLACERQCSPFAIIPICDN
jgi:hypothetical protein